MKSFLVLLAAVAGIAVAGESYYYQTPQTAFVLPASYLRTPGNSGFKALGSFGAGLSTGSTGLSGSYSIGTGLANSGLSTGYSLGSTGYNSGSGFSGNAGLNSGYSTGSGYNTGSSTNKYTSGSSAFGSGSGNSGLYSGYGSSSSGQNTGYAAGSLNSRYSSSSSGLNSGYSGGSSSGQYTGSGISSGLNSGYTGNNGAASGTLSNAALLGLNTGTGGSSTYNTEYSKYNDYSGATNDYKEINDNKYITISGHDDKTSGSNFGYQTNNDHSSHVQSSSNLEHYYNFIQQGPPQVFKHIYVHAAPEEPELPKTRQSIVLPPKQKHYNIIFIKAPAPPPSASHVVPVQQENEEKTLVYVLVKNQEEIRDVVLPKFTQKTPNKPEVYFIKYDSKEGVHKIINNIVTDHKGHDITLNGESINLGVSGANYADQLLTNKFGSDINSKPQGDQILSVSTLDTGAIFGGESTSAGNKESTSSSSGNYDNSNSSGSLAAVPLTFGYSKESEKKQTYGTAQSFSSSDSSASGFDSTQQQGNIENNYSGSSGTTNSESSNLALSSSSFDSGSFGSENSASSSADTGNSASGSYASDNSESTFNSAANSEASSPESTDITGSSTYGSAEKNTYETGSSTSNNNNFGNTAYDGSGAFASASSGPSSTENSYSASYSGSSSAGTSSPSSGSGNYASENSGSDSSGSVGYGSHSSSTGSSGSGLSTFGSGSFGSGYGLKALGTFGSQTLPVLGSNTDFSSGKYESRSSFGTNSAPSVQFIKYKPTTSFKYSTVTTSQDTPYESYGLPSFKSST